jgi:hypothetical protein
MSSFSCGLFYDTISIQTIASNGRMTDEQWIGKDLEGNSRGLIVALSWRLVLKKTTKTSVNIPAEIWTEHLQNTGLKRYHHINLPGVYSFSLMCFPCDEYWMKWGVKCFLCQCRSIILEQILRISFATICLKYAGIKINSNNVFRKHKQRTSILFTYFYSFFKYWGIWTHC